MKTRKKVTVLNCGTCIIAVCLPFSSLRCSIIPRRQGKPPCAVKGVLDLSSWNLQTQGPVRLSGEWEFYWKKLIAPDDFFLKREPAVERYHEIPGLWNRDSRPGAVSAALGYATYSLRLVGIKPQAPLALAIPEMRTSYRMWLDTTEVASNGVVASDKTHTIPQYLPQTITVFPQQPHVRLTIHVANFHGNGGGMPRNIIAGVQNQLLHRTVARRAFNIFIVGALLVISLYFVGLYAMGKKEPFLLHLGLLGAILITKSLVIGDRLLVQYFPQFPWSAILKIETLPTYLCIAIYTNFFYLLYPKEIDRRIYLFIFWASIGLSGLICVIPVTVMFSVHPVTQHLRTIAALYGMFILVLAILKKREGAVFIAIGFFFQLCTSIHDSLNEQSIIQSIYLSHAGLIVFSLFALSVINRRFIEAERYARERRDQLAHIEKLAALGTVVAGVAHEINNPNSTILLDAQTHQQALSSLFGALKEQPLRREIKIGGYTYDELKDDLLSSAGRMIRNSQRISRIVSNLRSLGRKEVPMNEDVDLNATVVSALGVVDHVVKRSTRTLNLNLAQDIPIIKGNLQHLEQVVINLVRNACQALEDMDQAVTISTAFDATLRMATLIVADEGAGMDEETRRNALVPHFTTKGGEGTGLGLPICKNIVTLHHGTISIESVRGRGTTIRIALPVTPAYV
ncbi:MAG: hypothetical protein JXA18_15895 [Chitinispirillaceae bacterium]|nr:hypothetical protein [Chitinispirillaceae bacterium]